MSLLKPTIAYPADLPVSRHRDDIMQLIRDHQVVIIAGETGSGKTTQLPKMAYEIGCRRIAHTQPRRLAARTIAERIAEETGTDLGTFTGYQVRFTDRVSDDTAIRLMTDGILLNAIHRDRLLAAYDCIIIDEAHERSLNIDFLLGYLKTILPKRPDLKVIITSATIDPESFAAHFRAADGAPAPIINVSGRTFPVEVRYRPLLPEAAEAEGDEAATGDVQGAATSAGQSRPTASQSNKRATKSKKQVSQSKQAAEPRDLFDGVCDAVAELLREESGDVLVFLSGESEIKDAANALQGRFGGNRARPLEVLPLYGRLSVAEQHRVFEPESSVAGARRVILATNVAETSLTVPGIKYVVDAGTARISRYSSRSKVQRLPIEPISQASANQRKGRAGRTSAGICIRLYSEEDFTKRPEYTDPEILRTGLASVILQMLALRIGDITNFPFLTPPAASGVSDGLRLLSELGAVVKRGSEWRLTGIGRRMSRLPIEPRFARMVLEAERQQVLPQVVALVAGLTVQDVRERPEAERGSADEAHSRFKDPLGDIMGMLNLWSYLREKHEELSSSAFRRLCCAEYLNYLRVREWMDLARQLDRTLELGAGGAMGKNYLRAASPAPERIHRAMLAGLLSHIGLRDERTGGSQGPQGGRQAGAGWQKQRRRTEYLGARGTKFQLHPGSMLAGRPPEAVMAVELVETSRLFARQVAVIDPAWAEDVAGELAKRSYSEPRWDAAAGQAVASEKVLVLGLPIVNGRRVQLARINRVVAREMFIRNALVYGQWYGRDEPESFDIAGRATSPHAFERTNRELLRQLQAEEHRSRRRGAASNDEAVYAFYDERVPGDVVSQSTFEKWWREAQKREPQLLSMSRADVLGDDAESEGAASRQDFPAYWRVGAHKLKLSYRFEPGRPDDGLTVTVPLPLLPGLASASFEQLVPGLRHELVTALIRTLPKPIRRHVVPAGDWAELLLESIAGELGGGATDEEGAGRSGAAGGAGGSAAAGGSGSEGNIRGLLAAEIRRRTSALATADDFDLSRLPVHLRAHFRVVDARGRTLGRSDSLEELQEKLGEQAARAVSAVVQRGSAGTGGSRGAADVAGPAAVHGAAARGRGQAGGGASQLSGAGVRATDWQFGAGVPAYVDSNYAGGRGAGIVRAYPALQDGGDHVELVLTPDEESQRVTHARGLRRLVLLSTPSPEKYVADELTNDEKLLLTTGPYRGAQAAIADIAAALADEAIAVALADDGTAPGAGQLLTREQFEAACTTYAAGLVDRMFDAAKLAATVLRELKTARKALEAATSMSVLGQVQDARNQLAALFPVEAGGVGFIARAGLTQLTRYPVYLAALTQRMRALPGDPGRDRVRQNEIDTATALFTTAGGELPLPVDASPTLLRVRWLLEELRVSLFAQQLGTAESVSVTRIRKALGD